MAHIACTPFAHHGEHLHVHTLKTDSSHARYNRLVNYTYAFVVDAGVVAEGYKDVFVGKAAGIESLTWMKISYALGSLAHEDMFRLPAPLPKFGSFLIANVENDDDFVTTGFLAGAFFSLANNRITAFEKTKHEESNLYWYSYSAEHFCVDQLYKMLKFYPDQGMHKLLTEGKYNMFKFSYAAVEFEYTLLPNNSRKVSISMYTAIPNEIYTGFTKIPFESLDTLDPEDDIPPISQITEHNHYLEKSKHTRITPATTTTIKDALDQVKDSRQSLEQTSAGISVDRFVRGRIGTHSNTLVAIVRNSAHTDAQVSVVNVFDSHQYAFLSDISVMCGDVACEKWQSRYIQSIKKPFGNLNITLIETNVTVPADTIVEIRMPFMINFRKISEYEQEYERGTYLLGSIAIIDSYQGRSIQSLPAIQTNEKQIDSTYAFTTLTINNIFFFTVPVVLMFNAISSQ